jgi:hypothetical protein
LLGRLRAKARSSALHFGVDIGDYLDENVNVGKEGLKKALEQVDSVTFMAYHTHWYEIVQKVATEAGICDALSKPFLVGVETNELPGRPATTFAGSSNWRLQSEIRNAIELPFVGLKAHKTFSGIAVHDYHGYKSLSRGTEGFDKFLSDSLASIFTVYGGKGSEGAVDAALLKEIGEAFKQDFGKVRFIVNKELLEAWALVQKEIPGGKGAPGVAALTAYETVVVADAGQLKDVSILAHELWHVVQYRKLGMLQYIQAYTKELLEKGYDKVSFELEARQKAEEFVTSRGKGGKGQEKRLQLEKTGSGDVWRIKVGEATYDLDLKTVELELVSSIVLRGSNYAAVRLTPVKALFGNLDDDPEDEVVCGVNIDYMGNDLQTHFKPLILVFHEESGKLKLERTLPTQSGYFLADNLAKVSFGLESGKLTIPLQFTEGPAKGKRAYGVFALQDGQWKELEQRLIGE